jgi:cysteine desulfurase
MEEPPLIYLDNAATTRVAPEVFEAMTPFLQDDFGNPSSIYSLAGRSASAIESARASVAGYMGALPDEIIFTGGGSEANNLAIKGTMWKKPDGHMITSAIEHHAVLHSCEALAKQGYDLTVLPVDGNALVDPEDVRRALRPDTRLITIMHSNNEVGTVQPIVRRA